MKSLKLGSTYLAPGVAGLWLKNKMIPFVKGFQFTTTSCSSTKKVTEQFAIDGRNK